VVRLLIEWIASLSARRHEGKLSLLTCIQKN